MSLTTAHIAARRWRVAAFLVLLLLSVLFTMATALSVADFLKLLFNTGDSIPSASSGNLVAQGLEGLYVWLIGFGPGKALVLFSLLLLLLYGLKNLFGYMASIQASVIRVGVVHDLRDAMFGKTLRLPMSFFSQQRKGLTLAHFGSDMVEYEESILTSLQQLATAVVSIVLYLLMLFYINW